MKIGRNDACPCGSGKKYKKCCLGKLTSTPAQPSDPDHNYAPARQLDGMSPPGTRPLRAYTIAKLTEKPESAGKNPRLQRDFKRYSLRCWSRAKVAALSTEQLEAQLHAFGVRHSQQRFLQLSEGIHSAWELSEKWFSQDPVTCRGIDEDFVGLAACELWKRLLSERPSVEMVDDWIEEGNRFEYEDEPAACEVWWKAWCALQPRFLPRMKRMDATLDVYDGTYLLFNWCQSFECALHNASLRDPKFIPIAERYCREWLAQFVGESDGMRVTFNRTLAEFTFRLGKVEQAQAILEQTLATWPDDPWSYVALADAWSHLFADRQHHLPFDVEKARQFLLAGLSRLRGKADRHVLEDRLASLSEAIPAPDRPLPQRK